MRNGNFGSALAGTWSLNVNSAQGAAATVQTTTATSATSGGLSAQISVRSAASDPANYASVQFSQTGLAPAPAQVYRLMFWAKAGAARSMHFDVTNTAADASLYSSVVALTTTWQQYVVYFQATAAVPTAQVDFDFGDQTGNAWLDGVVLQGSTP